MPTAPRRNKYCSDDDQGPARVHQGAFTPGSNGVQVRFIDPRKGPAMIRRSIRFPLASCPCGGMVDAADSKSVAGDSVLVQVRPGAPAPPQAVNPGAGNYTEAASRPAATSASAEGVPKASISDSPAFTKAHAGDLESPS